MIGDDLSYEGAGRKVGELVYYVLLRDKHPKNF